MELTKSKPPSNETIRSKKILIKKWKWEYHPPRTARLSKNPYNRISGYNCRIASKRLQEYLLMINREQDIKIEDSCLENGRKTQETKKKMRRIKQEMGK